MRASHHKITLQRTCLLATKPRSRTLAYGLDRLDRVPIVEGLHDITPSSTCRVGFVVGRIVTGVGGAGILPSPRGFTRPARGMIFPVPQGAGTPVWLVVGPAVCLVMSVQTELPY